MEINCLEIAHGSPAYYKTIALREEQLRRPLGLTFKGEDLSGEKNSFHLAAYSGEELLACLVLLPVGDTTLKMRQVATRANWQGKGIGRQLVKFSERFASGKGYKLLQLHARQTAVPFYDKLNYERVGGIFEEVGIPHQKMQKEL